jgi:fibronectin-binding autotransporter adhesin
MTRGRLICATLFFGLLCWATGSAVAATLSWDPGITGGSTVGGSGTWDTNTSTNWWSGAADGTWTDTTGTATAFFGGSAGTVTVSGKDTVNALNFNTPGYVLTGGSVNLAGTAPAIAVNAGSTTINSAVTGSAGLTKTGSGSLVLGGALLYSGSTTVSAGTLQVGSFTVPTSGGGPVSTSIAAGATMIVTGPITLQGTSSSLRLVNQITGAGTLQFASNSSLASPDIYANTHIGSGYGITTNVNINLGATTTRWITGQAYGDDYGQYGSGDLGLFGQLAGTNVNVTVQGTGTSIYSGAAFDVVLGGNNSAWTGPLTVVQGQVALANPAALSSANDVYLNTTGSNYAQLYLFGNNVSIGSLFGTGPGTMSIRNGSYTTGSYGALSNAILTVNQATSGTFAGIIANGPNDYEGGKSGVTYYSLGLTKSGSATLTLTGVNTYSGTTTVNNGTLAVPLLANGGVLSTIGSSSNSAANLVLAGGVLQYIGGGASTDRLFTLGAAGEIDASGSGPLALTNTGSIAFSGAGSRTLTLGGSNSGLNSLAATIADSGVGSPTSVVKTGPGTWVLAGSNAYTGTTSAQQGLLQFGPGSSLSGPLAVNGGTVALSNSLTAPSTSVQQGLLQLNGGSSLQSPVTLSGGGLLVNNPLSSGTTQTVAISNLNVAVPSAINFQAGTTWNAIGAGNPVSNTMLADSGPLALNSMATINVASFAPLAVGDFSLMALNGGTSGTSSLVLGSLPPRAQAHLDFTTDPGYVLLDITGFDTIKWTGTASTAWDTTTQNWQTVIGKQATAFIPGDTVAFDDTAATGSVNIASPVQPASVTFKNNNLAYILSGTSGIVGTATTLTLNGSGSVTLATNNTYGGGTFINGGTLSLGDGLTAGAGSITGNVTLSNTATGGAVLQFNHPLGDTMLLAGNISGSGSLVQSNGLTILTGANTYAGLTTINGGSLQIGNGAASGTVPGDITNNAALIYNRSDSVVLANTISGNGTTYVNSGTLQVGNNGTAGWISGPIVTNALLAFNRADNVTYSGVISGSGGVAQWGSNDLTLTGSNTYTGPTSINAGVLTVGSVAGLGSPTSSANIALNGGTLEFAGASGTAAHGVTVNAGGATFQIDNPTQTLALAGLASGAGSLAMNGPGTLILGGLNLSSPTQVNGGTLAVLGNINTHANSPIVVGAGAVFQSGATLNLDVNQNGSQGSTNVTGPGTVQLVSTTGSPATPDIYFGPDHSGNSYWGAAMNVATLDLGATQRYIDANSGHNAVGDYYSSTYTDARLSSNIIGSGGITFTASSAYSGQWAELLLTGSNTFSGPLVVNRGAIFLNNPSALTQANAVTLSNSDSTFSNFFILGDNTTISNLQSAGATPGYTGVANGNPGMSGPAQVANPATLTINQTVNTGFAGTIANAISDNYNGSTYSPGPLSIAKTGPATLTLAGTNSSYTGTTSVNGGVLSVALLANGGANSSIGASTNNASNLLLQGGTLQYIGGAASTDRLFTLDAAGGAIDASGSGPLSWTNAPGPIAFSGTTAAGAPRTLTLSGSSTAPNTMGIALSDDTTNSIPTAVVKSGPGTWVMTAANTYTGKTTVQQGQLQFGAGGTLQGPLVVSGGSAITSDGFAAGSGTVQQGLLQFNGGNSLAGGLAVVGGTAAVNTSSSLTAAVASVQHGMLQLNAGSTLTLQSPLTLSAGTLLISNPVGGGATQAANITANVTVASPSALNLQAGATWDPSVPLINLEGSLTLNSSATINVGSLGLLSVNDYPLIAMNGEAINGTSGISGLLLGSLPARVQAHIDTTSNPGFIDLDVAYADTIKWTGAQSNTWDTTTKNWLTVISGTATTYIAQQPAGDAVYFYDGASRGAVDIPAVVQPSRVTVDNNALNYTFTTSTGTGGIYGGAFLAKSGSGSLTLVTNNNYTGGTTVSGGTLTLGDGVTSGQGSITGDVALDNTATRSAVLQFNRPDQMLFAGNITGNGSVIQAGSGLTILTGSNTYTVGTLISGGSLQIGNRAGSGQVATDIGNNGTVIFSRSDSVIFANNISGSGSLVQAGPGMLTLTGSNPYTGLTTASGGTLQLGDGNTMPLLNGPLVTNALLAFNPPSAYTYSGVLQGTGGVAQVGINPLTLSASNTYSGPTYINGGTLSIVNAAGIGSTSSSASVVFNGGGTLDYSGTTATVAHGLLLGSGGTATFQIDNAGQTLTFTGTAGGAGGLVNNGPGNLVLAGTGVITGPVAANANTTVPSLSAPPATGSVTIASGAVLGVTGKLTLNPLGSGYVTNVTGGGTLALMNPSSSIANPDIYANVSSNSYWGVQIATAINLGSGNRFIGGHAGNNDYGQYGQDGNGDLGLNGPLYGSANVTVQGLPQNSQFEVVLAGSNTGWTGGLNIVQGDVAAIVPNALNGNSVTFAPSGGTATTALYIFGQDITIGSLSGTGSGNMWIRNGSLISGGNPNQPQSNAVLTINQTTNGTFAGVMSDGPNDYYGGSSPNFNLGIVKAGSATLTLTGTNTYTGPTTVSGGILSVPTLANGGSASSIGASTNNAGNLVLAGGTLLYTGSGASTDRLFTLDVAGGTIAASGSGPLNWTNTGTIAFSGTATPGVPRTLTLTGTNTGLNTMGITIADGLDTTTAVLKTGPGTWVLSPSNTYSGPTTVQQGLLQLGPGANLAGPLTVSGGSASVVGGSAVQGLLTLGGGTSGATLSVYNTVAAGTTQSTTLAAGLTVSSPSTLNVQAGTRWNPSVPFFNGEGSLTLNSTATINVASFAPLGVGNYPLFALSGGTLNGSSGASGLVLGSLPARVQATLVPVNQGGVEMLDLDVTVANGITWTGSVSTAWDTTTANWLTSTGGTTTYIAQSPAGDAVTFDDTAHTGSVNLASVVQPNFVTVNNNALNYTFKTSSGTGGINGIAYLTKSGSGNLTLVTNNNYSNGTFINGGTVTLGDGVTTGEGSIVGNVSLSNSATGTAVLAFNRPDNMLFAGNISGAGSLLQAGSGLTILTGANTYAGSTAITGGSLQIGNGGSNGQIVTDVTNYGTLIFSRSDSVTFANNISGSGSVVQAGPGLLILNNTNPYTGVTTVNGGTLQLGDGNTIPSLNGAMVTNSLLAFNPPGAYTYSGVIRGSGGVAEIGVNPLTLTASNTYNGPTYVSTYLTLGDVSNVGSLSSTASIVFNGGNGNTMEYTGTASETAAHGMVIGAGGLSVQVDNPGTTLGLTGPVSGAGGLSIQGPGNLTIGGLSLGGPILVNGGTLAVLGSISAHASSAITVNTLMQSAATLNLDVNQNSATGSQNVTGMGTLQLVSTTSSLANPDLFFGPDHSGTSYYGAGITVGTLDLGNSQRYFRANSGHNGFARYDTAGVDAYIQSNIVGSGGITYTGYSYNTAATSDLYAEMVLAGSNTFSGPLVVNQGAIFLDSPTALAGSNAVTLSSSATGWSHLFLFGNNATITNLQSAGPAPGNTAIANGTPTMTQFQVVNPVTLTINETANTTFAGAIADKITDNYDSGSNVPGALSLDKTGPATLVLSGNLSFTGSNSVDGGTLVLSGTNSYLGGTFVNSGTLVLGNQYAIPAGSELTVGAAASSAFGPAALAPSVASPSAAAVPESSALLLLAAAFGIAVGYGSIRRRKTWAVQ